MKDIARPSAGPKAREGVETYIVPDGSCFLFDPASDASFTLDQLGALVWDFCDGLTPVDRIIHEITELLPDDADAPSRARLLLTEFAKEGLLESTGDTLTAEASDD